MGFSLETLKQHYDLEIHWRSFELRPAGSPPIPEEYKAKILAARPNFEATMKKNLGVTINAGPWGINSRPSLIGHKIALEQGAGDAYHNATMRAYWELAQSIQETEVLAAIAEAAGMDRAAFVSALDDPKYDELVTADVMEAYQGGIQAVPASVFNMKYLLSGAHPIDTFIQVIEQVQKEMAAENG